jgi:hypothetical protein
MQPRQRTNSDRERQASPRPDERLNGMGISDTLVAELRSLRKRSGPLTAAKLAKTPMILMGLGGGNPVEALSRLTLIASSQDDAEIKVAIATLGHEGEGGTVLSRLDQVAAQEFVDQRTVRRWSDAGIEKLAHLILSASPWMEPRCRLRLRLSAEAAQISAETYGPRDVAMYEPTLTVDREVVEVPWALDSTQPHAVSGTSGVHTVPWASSRTLLIGIRWRGNLEASYWLDVDSAIPTRIETRIMLREFQVRIRKLERSP